MRPPGGRFFQRKVSYDQLVEQALPGLRAKVGLNAQELLEKLDAQMAPFDRDANPEVDGSGRKRAMIGIYYFEEDCDDDASSSEDA